MPSLDETLDNSLSINLVTFGVPAAALKGGRTDCRHCFGSMSSDNKTLDDPHIPWTNMVTFRVAAAALKVGGNAAVIQ